MPPTTCIRCASCVVLAISTSRWKTRELLALWRDKSRASADVKNLAMAHVRELEEKAAELKAMADTLRHLATHCHGDHRPDCPILADFATTTPTQGKA